MLYVLTKSTFYLIRESVPIPTDGFITAENLAQIFWYAYKMAAAPSECLTENIISQKTLTSSFRKTPFMPLTRMISVHFGLDILMVFLSVRSPMILFSRPSALRTNSEIFCFFPKQDLLTRLYGHIYRPYLRKPIILIQTVNSAKILLS